MEIEICHHKKKCDFTGCVNFAKYSLSTNKKLKGELVFCEDCLSQMYCEIAKLKVPKGINSPFKLNERLRRKNEE